MTDTPYDLLIIGGGINGAGIAADASGRGLTVALVEQDDLASHTSSASSKLIHGGLRYLESYEFRLVREALQEREILLNKARHLIHPLRLIMPHNPHLRPAWMIRAGLFLYDHLNLQQSLPKSKAITIDSHNRQEPLNQRTTRGFVYSDATVDDARLVIANAQQAHEQGAYIGVHQRLATAKRHDHYWMATIEDQSHQTSFTLKAKAIVNAAGPWVDTVLRDALHTPSQDHVRLVQGSHLVTRKLYDGDQAYLLQNDDQRIVFVIPYRNDFTLIGTTDTPYHGDPRHVSLQADEKAYLLTVVNHYFKKNIGESDIVWSYSGVRPLHSDEHSDPSKVTRDYTLTVADHKGQLPVLSIFGGKVTTYRRLAEHALEKLRPYFPSLGQPWTANAPLPGGDFVNIDQLLTALHLEYPKLPLPLLRRYALNYGTRTRLLLQDAQALDDLGEDFGHGLHEREISYLMTHEWARSAEDILWRRTKHGLYLTPAQIEHLYHSQLFR